MPDFMRTHEVIGTSAVDVGTVSTLYQSPINTEDCEGVMFLIRWSSNATAFKTSTAWAHLQYSTKTTGLATAANWTNLGTTVGLGFGGDGATMGKRIGLLDCYKPLYKHIRLGMHNCSGDYSVTTIKYGMRRTGTTESLEKSSTAGYKWVQAHALQIGLTS